MDIRFEHWDHYVSVKPAASEAFRYKHRRAPLIPSQFFLGIRSPFYRLGQFPGFFEVAHRPFAIRPYPHRANSGIIGHQGVWVRRAGVKLVIFVGFRNRVIDQSVVYNSKFQIETV